MRNQQQFFWCHLYQENLTKGQQQSLGCIGYRTESEKDSAFLMAIFDMNRDLTFGVKGRFFDNFAHICAYYNVPSLVFGSGCMEVSKFLLAKSKTELIKMLRNRKV